MAKATAAATTKKNEALKNKEKAATIKKEAARILDKDPETENDSPKEDGLPTNEDKSKKELLKEINWFDLKTMKRQKTKEEPLHIMVYFRVIHYPQKRKEGTKPRVMQKKGDDMQRHGKITFSKFLSNKYGLNCKIKFGALDGKIIFQVNKTDGITPKLASKDTEKICISCADVVEIIFNKYKLNQGAQSAYFKIKDLGNDFYLIDELFK